jgi:hypothetical protein
MLAHLDVGEMIALSRTCKVLSPLWNTFIDTGFDIDIFLREYFSEPRSFRSLQAEHGILIDRGAACRFFKRTIHPRRLQICVNRASFAALQTFLLQDEYLMVVAPSATYYRNMALGKVEKSGRTSGILVNIDSSLTSSLS